MLIDIEKKLKQRRSLAQKITELQNRQKNILEAVRREIRKKERGTPYDHFILVCGDPKESEASQKTYEQLTSIADKIQSHVGEAILIETFEYQELPLVKRVAKGHDSKGIMEFPNTMYEVNDFYLGVLDRPNLIIVPSQQYIDFPVSSYAGDLDTLSPPVLIGFPKRETPGEVFFRSILTGHPRNVSAHIGNVAILRYLEKKVSESYRGWDKVERILSLAKRCVATDLQKLLEKELESVSRALST